MIVSRTWLQTYFETALPEVEELAELLLLHAFEIEEVRGDLIDIDVLPNRAHDCLSHQGIAQEIASLLGYSLKQDRYATDVLEKLEYELDFVSLSIESDLCRAYHAFQINNISLKEIPSSISEGLEVLGQRRIHPLVDLTNYIMFDLGQPLHVFDADKVVGAITVRLANKREMMTTLSGEEIELSNQDLVIADEQGILALAGVKGGIKAEVDSETKNVIVEIANFDPIAVRNARARHKLFTDSSKRFENDLHESVAGEIVPLVQTLFYQCTHGENTQWSPVSSHQEEPRTPKVIEVHHTDITRLLGIDISSSDIENIFERYLLSFKKAGSTYLITPPYQRLDLGIKEDLIEEIGRVYGYHNIPNQVLDNPATDHLYPPLHLYINTRIRSILFDQGYTELMSYRFTEKGAVELKNPMASDKKFLRDDIYPLFAESFEQNLHNADFFGMARILNFELGRIYSAEGEKTQLVIACKNMNKQARKKYGTEEDQLAEVLNSLKDSIGMDAESVTITPVESVRGLVLYASIVLNYDQVDNNVVPYSNLFTGPSLTSDSQYQSFNPISHYPFSRRDISLWVSEDVSVQDVRRSIIDHAGPYLQKIFLFDEFHKDGNISYAFSLIFQARDRTLVDTDIDHALQTVIHAMKSQNWEVR